MSGADADDNIDQVLPACRAAARRRLRERVGAIVRHVRAPLSAVLRDHALVHLPPAAAARLRAVHPSWARAVASPLFAVAHAAAPRRLSGLFLLTSSSGSSSFLHLDAADTLPSSPPLAFLPASAPPAVRVLSSTRGLACCFSPADDAYFVCNPATEAWEPVPSPPCRLSRPRPALVLLLGADLYNFRGDYTLVCAFEAAPGPDGAYCFAVFSSGAGEWWVAPAVAPAEGLVPASGVAAGGTAWWRTDIGTAVGYCPATGRVHLAVCPGDSARWEIGAAGDTLHCAVRADGGDAVVVFRLGRYGGWEQAATVSVAEILHGRGPWQPAPAYYHEPSEPDADADGEADQQDRARAIVAVENRAVLRILAGDDVRLLPFQGADVEVLVLDLHGRRVVAFDTVTRRRREAVLPDEPAGTDWAAAEYAAHTNTLALLAPVALMDPPDDHDHDQQAEAVDRTLT
ncbi:hypothetical protein U9M48_010723 [Paspalum notatum var. saurae]|uniref:Uncharacterized protein n=1 Tax=Paspalum notatum var. saurae TaxID=547442 RepID=A0AAQ3WGC8_PASNO